MSTTTYGKYGPDVADHPRTKNLDPSFYTEYYRENQKPYVRVVRIERRGTYTKKDHRVSEIFGLVCVHETCMCGDVHRHTASEIRLIDNG